MSERVVELSGFEFRGSHTQQQLRAGGSKRQRGFHLHQSGFGFVKAGSDGRTQAMIGNPPRSAFRLSHAF